MNKFDQQIKEKVNEIKYPYKSVYWNNFVQNAHWKITGINMKLAFWIAMGSIGVACGSYTIYHFINQNHSNQDTTIMPSQITQDSTYQYVDFADTISYEQKTETSINSQIIHQEKSQTKLTQNITHSDTTKSSPIKIPQNLNTDSVSNIKWRVLTIDVDTISSNR